MAATEVAAASAPAWDVWTVAGTAGTGAAVALLVDFFLKPRLQVRNDRFSQRAKDRGEVLRVVRAIMIEARKGIAPGSFDPFPEDARSAMELIADEHNKARLAKLMELSEELQDAYALAGQYLPPVVLRLVESAGGSLHGLLLAGADMNAVSRQLTPLYNLLYDVLMTSRFQIFAYRSRLAWVRMFLDSRDPRRREAVLRDYGISRLGS